MKWEWSGNEMGMEREWNGNGMGMEQEWKGNTANKSIKLKSKWEMNKQTQKTYFSKISTLTSVRQDSQNLLFVFLFIVKELRAFSRTVKFGKWRQSKPHKHNNYNNNRTSCTQPCFCLCSITPSTFSTNWVSSRTLMGSEGTRGVGESANWNNNNNNNNNNKEKLETHL